MSIKKFAVPRGPFDVTFNPSSAALPPPVGVVFDASITAPIGGAGTSFTDSTSMTIGSGANRALLVMLIWDQTVSAPSVTWNGVPLTLLVSKAASGSTSQVAIFGLRNPDSGTQTLAGSWTAPFGDFVVGAVSFTGVDQSNDATAFQNAVSSVAASSPASITATSATNDMVAAVFGFNNAFSSNGFTAVSPNTFFNLVNSNDAVGAGVYAAGASSVTLTATYGIGANNAAAAINLHAAGAANASPFNQTDFPKVLDIRQAPFSPDQALNINLFKNPFPFNQYDFLKPKRIFVQQTNLFEQPYNLSIYELSVTPPDPPAGFIYLLGADGDYLLGVDGDYLLGLAPMPFNQANQTDSALNPYRTPDFLPNPNQSFNINLYSSVVTQLPFTQMGTPSVYDVKQIPLPPDTLNINLFKNPFPFDQYDYPKTFNIHKAPFFPHETLNINLFTNSFPLNQTDWSKPLRLKQAPFIPTDPVNINLFTNPFPNNQYDYLKPRKVPQAPYSPTDPLNINLFTNPFPTLNLDLDTQVRLRPIVDSSQPYNVNLYGIVVVTVPFNQVDFAKPFVPRPAVMLDQSFNPNVFTNPYPFNQYDFLKPFRTPDFQPDPDQSVNINVFATVPLPFIPIDWNKPFVPKFPSTIDQALNVNLFTNPYPFNQYDYLKPRKVPQAPYDVSFQLNPNLNNFFPFNQYDYLRPLRTPHAPIVIDQALNINTFTNPYPFNQYDWSKPIKVPQAPIKVDQQANLGMLFSPFPFVQYDYAKPVRVPTAPFDKSVSLNLNLFTNPFPFNQYAWPAASRLKIGYAPQLYSAALYSPVVVTATLHPVKFIGNVGNMLIR